MITGSCLSPGSTPHFQFLGHSRHSVNICGMAEFLRGWHLFSNPFFCCHWQHNVDGWLCYDISSLVGEKEERACVRKADLCHSKKWMCLFIVSGHQPVEKMFYRAECGVSNKNASSASEMPEVQWCWLLFKGVMFSFVSSLYPETWIEFCTGHPGGWQDSPAWKLADCNAWKGDLF